MPIALYGRPYPADGNACEVLAPNLAGTGFVRAVGDTPAAAAAAFRDLWEAQPDRDPMDPIEMVRCVRVRVELALVLDVDGGKTWRARASIGDGTDLVCVDPDRSGVEAAFMDAWNQARGTDFNDVEFAFDRIG